MSIPNIPSGQLSNGRQTQALVSKSNIKGAEKGKASGVIIPPQFDENSELADAVLAEAEEEEKKKNNAVTDATPAAATT